MASRKHNDRKTTFYFAVTEYGDVLRGYYGNFTKNTWEWIFWAKPMQPGRTYIHGNVVFRLIRFTNGEQALFRCKREWPHDMIDQIAILHPVEIFQYEVNYDGSGARVIQLGKHHAERENMVRCFQNCRLDYTVEFRDFHVFNTHRLRGHPDYTRDDPIFQRIGLFNVTEGGAGSATPLSEDNTTPTQPLKPPMEIFQ